MELKDYMLNQIKHLKGAKVISASVMNLSNGTDTHPVPCFLFQTPDGKHYAMEIYGDAEFNHEGWVECYECELD